MRETLMWNRWCKCFYSSKETLRDNPSEEKIIEKSHYKPMYRDVKCAWVQTGSVCPIVIDITVIDAISTISFDQTSWL